MRNVIILFLIGFSSYYGQEVVSAHDHPGLTFTENIGQWNNTILYRAGLDGGALFLEKDRLTFNLYDKFKARQFHNSNIRQGNKLDDKINGHAFSIVFEGCNKENTIDKLQQGVFYENYFIDNDKSKWKSNVKNYHQLWIKNLYNSIDYEILTIEGNIKYNIHVMPNGNIDDVKLNYQGIDRIQLRKGELSLKTEFTELVEQKPYAYQVINGVKKEVACEFVLKNNTISYKLPRGYDKRYELVIDPLLVFAAQSGSTADNFGMTATYDAFGNLYAGGIIFNIGYPTTLGAYSSTFFGPVYYGNTDVVITKYNSKGNALLFSTYFGGDQTETVNSLIVDNNDNLCFYGVTGSSNFPTTANAYDKSFNGGPLIFFYNNGHRFNNGTDIYVAKFNTAGTALLASTYIGGSSNDGINHSNRYQDRITDPIPPNTIKDTLPEPLYDSLQYNYGDHSRGEIQLDNQNNIYITSSTRSSDFPTVNAFDNTLGGKQDAVLFKFNSNLSTLLFSSFIGGSSNDSGNGLVVDNNNEIYVTGGTCSKDFPHATGGYQSTYQGGKSDGYIIRVNALGNTVLNGTYFGTSLYDQSYLVQSDKQNNIYVFGQSLGNMPILKATTSSTVFSVPKTHQFISRFNKTLDVLNMSTVFGFDTLRTDISPAAFSVDKCSNIYLSGWGAGILPPYPPLMRNMPLMNPTQSTTDGHDFYFMGLDSNATVLKYGSYFGGKISSEHVDGGTSRFDPQGVIYQSVCAGCGGNNINGANQDFPVTPGAWPGTPGNPNHNTDNFNCNNGVIKINFQINSSQANISANTLSGCMPLTVKFTNSSTPGYSYLWDFGNNDTTSQVLNPIKTFTAIGSYTVNLYVTTSICYNLHDTAKLVITVYPLPVSNFTAQADSCSNIVQFTNQSNPLIGPYKWYLNPVLFASTQNPSYSFISAGTYTVKLVTTNTFGCKDSVAKTIVVPVDSFRINPPISKCNNQAVSLLAQGATSYTWSPVTGLSNPFIANPICTAQTNIVYTVTVIQNSLLGKVCIKTLTTAVTVFPKITSAFTYSIGACNNNVQFTDASTLSPTSWVWNYGDVNNGNIQNPLHYYSLPGTYTVSLIVTNSYGCKDSSKQVLNLLGFTPVTVSANVIKCEPDTVQLHATGGIIYSWIPTQYLSNANIADPFAFPPVTTIYTVTIGNINGIDTCFSKLNTTVSIFPFAYNTASISVSATTLTLGQSEIITLNGFPYTGTITLSPSVPFTFTGNNTITFTPLKPGEYSVYFSDQFGCQHLLKTIFIVVHPEECNEGVVYLPTGFTPNGDGTNDVLYIRSNFITEVYLTIYDRWGEKLFETSDIKNGWDGVYKGKQLDQGVYGYYMTFKCNNGQESFKKGNITLMR